MICNRWSRNLVVTICALLFNTSTGLLVSWAQSPQTQAQPGQYPPGQFPPNRPQPLAIQCQSALADQISANAGRRVSLNPDTQNP